jgi:hypothetical protein
MKSLPKELVIDNDVFSSFDDVPEQHVSQWSKHQLLADSIVALQQQLLVY